VPTDIQAATIPHALADRDILGAAKTGSGKTLAFVVPLVERLFRERWSSEDGLGAIIITPTRELALQVRVGVPLYRIATILICLVYPPICFAFFRSSMCSVWWLRSTPSAADSSRAAAKTWRASRLAS